MAPCTGNYKLNFCLLFALKHTFILLIWKCALYFRLIFIWLCFVLCWWTQNKRHSHPLLTVVTNYLRRVLMPHKWKVLKVNTGSQKNENAAASCTSKGDSDFLSFFFFFLTLLLSRIGTLEGSPCKMSPSIMLAVFPQQCYWHSKLKEAHIR